MKVKPNPGKGRKKKKKKRRKKEEKRKKEEEKKGKKRRRKRRNKQKKKQPNSLPSLRERSETPGALDRRALGITA